MKKILFLVTQSEFGGAQRYIYEVAKVLSKNYEVLVAAGRGDGELFRKLKDAHCSHTAQVQPLYLKQMKREPWPWQIILAVKEIFDLLKKEKPDVLFLCSTTAGLLGSIASFFYRNLVSKKETKFLTIYRIGGWAFRDPRPFWQNWAIFWAEKLTARFKDMIIVNSEYDWRMAVKKRIVSPEKIIKIYNGIDIDSLDFFPKEEARRRLSVSDTDRRLVGCVANFYKTKGLEYFIEAVRILCSMFEVQSSKSNNSNISNNSNFKLIIIGEGKERPKLEALIKKYGLENKIILAGRIPDAYKYLKAFDVFILPSLKEGFPWVILEAIAAEIPIVATKVGAMPEILDEEFLVEPGNSQSLAKKISRMLEHPTKPKLKQEFTSQKMVEATEKLLSLLA